MDPPMYLAKTILRSAFVPNNFNSSGLCIKVSQLGLSEILFQQANVANLPNFPNWPWPMKESINLIGGVTLYPNLDVKYVTWKVQMVERLWFCIGSMIEHK